MKKGQQALAHIYSVVVSDVAAQGLNFLVLTSPEKKQWDSTKNKKLV